MNTDKHGGYMELLEKDLTEKIIAACLEVSNELGAGFLESVYERALLIALTDKGLKAETQVPLKVVFRNRVVGDFYADTLVENLVIIELKAVKSIGTENEAQLINYLKATNKRVGLLVNFGKPKLEWKRFVY
ncbi:MAG: GxxExxY protein [Planctomycetes bacterium]|nr:GxxExxY protein [Planctomycetota bacterium]OHB41548.1 MAG: GxxExxY protein [Planctomycetes bacterium GWC2_39_26]